MTPSSPVTAAGPDAELDPAGRVEWLREQIRRHDAPTTSQDAPTIPDADYDALVRELRTPRGLSIPT